MISPPYISGNGANFKSLLLLSRDELPPSVLEHFRSHGFSVTSSTSPLQVSTFLVKHAPTAVYLGLSDLPEDAGELVSIARQHAPSALVVVGLRREERGRAARLLEAGADAYVIEPLVAEELLALLKQKKARENAASEKVHLEASHRAAAQLARVIAHQVNNPLGTLSGWMQMLKDGEVDPETLSRIAQSAEAELERLQRVVQSLLIISEQMSPRRKLVSLGEVLQNILNPEGPEEERIPVTLPEGLPPVAGDADLLAQALEELIYGETLRSAGSQPLSLEVSPNGRMLVLDLLLAGDGLDDHRLRELLDPLRVFDEQGNDAALAFARAVGVIRVHGGELTAERELDGRSHLTVKLPVALV